MVGKKLKKIIIFKVRWYYEWHHPIYDHHCIILLCVCVCVCVHVCVRAQSCPSLCDPRTVTHQAPLSMEFSQARILDWIVISFTRGSS